MTEGTKRENEQQEPQIRCYKHNDEFVRDYSEEYLYRCATEDCPEAVYWRSMTTGTHDDKNCEYRKHYIKHFGEVTQLQKKIDKAYFKKLEDHYLNCSNVGRDVV